MPTKTDHLTLLVQVTLNPNQLRSHLEPITDLDEVDAITLVADVPPPSLVKLRAVVPPRWLMRGLTRAGAKLVTTFATTLRSRPEWVLAYNLVPHGLTALLVARLTGRRALVHLIGGPREWEGGGFMTDNRLLSRLGRPVPALERVFVRAIRAFDHVAVMGSTARADLIRRGLPPEKVTVVPAGIDERLFSVDRAADPAYDVVTASQLIPRKRLEDLLEAAAALKPRHPDLKVAIAGRGALDDSLRARAAELGLADAVDFLGFVADTHSLYARSGIFALPSRSEGLSIAVCEAMAAGLAVVATDVGEIRDVVEPGVTGELFAVGDVEAFARHLDALLTDPDRRAAMGAAARARVHEHCRRSVVAASNRRIFAS